METRQFGRTGMNVSVLGFGAAEIGLQDTGRNVTARLLNIALDAGINVIDTAECYNNSEEMIGEAIGHRHADFFVFTKCGHAVEDGDVAWQPQTILRGIDRSLRRLKRDHVDLLQLHSCPLDLLRQGDVIDILEKIKASGKTRFIGCSADGRAAAYAIGTGKFDALQTSFSLADQDALDHNLPAALQSGMGVIVKRPIANAVWKHKERPADPWLHAYWDRVQTLDFDFLKQDRDLAFSTAMRFALTPAEVGTAIVGTSNPEHLLSNLRLIEKGRLNPEVFGGIRARWLACGGADWPAKG